MRPGDVVADRFEIERLAASGGMGSVYRARDRHTDGLAAVKIVHPAGPDAVERFAREARALSELRHPGIVTYLGHGRAGGGELYLAMEWLEGEDLAARLDTSELSVAETLALATGAAAALAVAHGRDVIHRDVKPSNLFLVDWRPGKLKLLDFGVARLARLAPLTATGMMVGTPLYMAPEQLRGERADARADVFALGAVLYRCLAGRPPFPAASAAELVARLAGGTEAAPLAEVPPTLSDLCARMLRLDPAARPRDASAVLGELIGLDATEPGRTPRARLGSLEQRLACVVTVAAPLDAALAAAAAAHGGNAEAAGARTTVVFAGGLAIDRAQQAARFALAARALAAAAPIAVTLGRDAAAPAGDGIRLDAAIAGLLGGRFDVAGDGAGLVLRGEAPGALAGPEGGELVGRDRELGLLEDLVDDGVARAVLITAPAGTGKSRLRQELVRRAGGRGLLLAGFGDPMRAGAPFGLLGEAVRRAAGIDGSEPLDERRARLRACVAETVAAADVERVACFLGELAGVPFDAEASVELRAARRDVVLLAEQIRAAWLDWLGAATARAPVILVLEDLHWGDLPTVRLVDDALQALAERPLVVLGLARPEVHELFPRLWAERGLQEIHLGALPRRAAERLVAHALPGAASATVAAIVERAGGNAFYLEELIRHVAEGRPGAFPDSVLAMAAARFDSLSAEARRALRAASVFGEVFWRGGVEALVGQAGIDELVARDLVQRRPKARFAGEEEYGFRHSLLREAAYALLTGDDRALGHRLAGGWLERAGEGEALVVAEHLERGGERGRAAQWYRRAAEQALAGNDVEAALAHAARGLGCDPAGAERGALHLAQATCHKVRGDTPAARDAGVAAMRWLPRGEEAWYAAAAEAASSFGKLNQAAELARVVDDVLRDLTVGPASATALARAAAQAYICGNAALGDHAVAPLVPLPAVLEREPGVVAWIEEASAFRALFIERDMLASRQHTGAAARRFDEAGDARNACLQKIQIGFHYMVLGDPTESRARLEALVAEADRLRMPIAALSARLYLTHALLAADQPAQALATIEPVVATLDGRQHPRVASLAMAAMGECLSTLGRDAEAEVVLRRAVGFGEAAIPNLFYGQSHLVSLLARTGRADEALALSMTIDAPESSAIWAEPIFLAARLDALVAAGRREEAVRLAAEGRARVLADLDRMPPPAGDHARTNPAMRRFLAAAAALETDAQR